MNDPSGAALGELLRAYRERALLSQEQLADRCGVSVRTIRSLETGRVSRPRGDSVRLLTDALGLTAAERDELATAARPAAAAPVPRQLPPDLPDFTGRSPQVAEVAAGLLGPGVPVVAVAGAGGVGKTALALRVAHQVADRFPDGQLYVDLRGARSEPLRAAGVLDRFLRALGVAGADIPADEAARAAAYRSALAGRRVLVVLDDAAGEAQVRPLLPGEPGCAVLVTARGRLPGLAGATPLDLAVLDRDQAVELLGRVAGTDRVAADPDTAAAIVAQCDGLPLAVRIAAARLAARPGWPLERLRCLLADERGRLDELAAGDLEVRASLALSYAALPEPERRAFRLLGAAGLCDFSGWVLAPLLEVPVPRAGRLVEALADARLLDLAADGDRYRFHELVRVYARELAGPAEDAARDRLTACWLALAEEADRRLPSLSEAVTVGPSPRWRLPAGTVDDLLADPLGWMDLERTNLVAAVEAAPAGPAWELAGRLTSYLLVRSDWDGGARVTRSALAACQQAGDVRGEAAMEISSAWAAAVVAPAAAGSSRRRIQRSLDVYAELDDELGQTAALLELAHLAPYPGPDSGWTVQLDHARRAMTLARRTGDLNHQLKASVLLGKAEEAGGRPARAVAAYEQALELARRLGATQNEADALWRLTLCRSVDTRPDEAVERLEESLEVFRDLGDRVGQARVLARLAWVLLDADRLAEAETRLTEARLAWPPTERRCRRPHYDDLLGRLRQKQDRPAEAAVAYRRAADGWGRQGRPADRSASVAAAAALQPARAGQPAQGQPAKTGPAAAALQPAEGEPGAQAARRNVLR